MNTHVSGHAIPVPPSESTLVAAIGATFASAPLPSGTGAQWTPLRLLSTLILMVWGKGSDGLGERFATARAAWPAAAGGDTYQGFVKAWRRIGLGLAYAAAAHLRQAIPALGDSAGTVGGWPVFAADGSRFDLPRTAEHERVFGIASKPGSAPQLWVTVLWHLGLGLPWAWRVGRAGASERDHLRALLGATPKGSLIVADAGFTGYDLLRDLQAGGRDFLVRVGRQVKLLTQLGYAEERRGGIVYLWPDAVQQREQPPLVLRLIRLRLAGDRRKKMYLLTSVLEAARLSDPLAGELYRRRWGVELMYRSLKQTLAARKLASHAPAQALLEIQGLLLGLTLLGLWQHQALRHAGTEPWRASAAAGLRVLRQGLQHPERPHAWATELAQAVKDPYPRRAKVRRPWPRKKAAARPPGRPRLRRAYAREIGLAQQLAAA